MKVCAIVVTYNPNIEVLARLLASLSLQVPNIVVVDNGSSNKEAIFLFASDLIHMHPLETNFGIAHAHNQGIAQARKFDAQAVLLMDQDSVPAHDMVQNLTDSLSTLMAKGKMVSAVGACYFGSEEDNESFFVRFGWLRFKRQYCSECEIGETLVPADFLISSGSLIPMSTIDGVGVMDERLFIDHVDTDWFLRAAHSDFHAYGECRALMEHGLGERTLKIWIGRARHVPQHRPFRYYYIFRNSVLLYRRSYAPINWVINDVWRLVGIGLLYTVFCAPRFQNLKMILAGIRDGLQGKTGRKINPPSTALKVDH